MKHVDRPGTAAILTALRRELHRQQISVAGLAAALGVAEPTAWRWLRGDGLTLSKLDQVCEVIGIDIRDLVERAADATAERFTLAQERILAADRGLALTFFAILHGGQRRELEEDFGLPPARLDRYLDRLKRMDLIDIAANGRLRARTRKSVGGLPDGPFAVAFDRNIKAMFLDMDFAAPDTHYLSDMVPLSTAGRERVMTLLKALREDIYLICEQEKAAKVEDRAWSAVLMFTGPLDLSVITSEWREVPDSTG